MALNVLIVDDERDVEQLYVQRFRHEVKSGEVKLHFAFCGNDALEILNGTNPMDILLVLSDINMPGMTGFELVKLIRSKFPELKVFMISAYGDDKHVSTAKDVGADDFIPKPVDFKILKEKIQSLKTA